MKIATIAVAGVLAGALITASPAQAEVAPWPAQSHVYPLRPSISLNPVSDAEELRRQVADLDAEWGNLTPDQRNQRIAGLQQQVTKVDQESRNLPEDQKAAVEANLLPTIAHLMSLIAKVQTPPTSPCIFPLCLPGL